MPQQDVAQRVQEIWAEFLAEGAPSSINLDSHSYERTSQNLKDPGRYSYEDAQVREPKTQGSYRGVSHWWEEEISFPLCLCNKADIKAFLPSLPIPLQSLREL